MSTSILAQSHPRVCDRTYGHAGNGSAPITDVILTVNMYVIAVFRYKVGLRLFLSVRAKKKTEVQAEMSKALFCFSDADRAHQSCGSQLPPYLFI